MDCTLCKYDALECRDYPCCECQGTAIAASPEYNKRPDMWEPITEPESEAENDAVNHPSHYTQGGIECIDAMKSAFGAAELAVYCKIAAFKYIWRCEHKNGSEDVQKAIWYMNTYLELEREANVKNDTAAKDN